MADDEAVAERITDDSRYLSAAEPPTPNTRLVPLRPMLRLDDDSAVTLQPDLLEGEFPNQGRVTWSRPTVDPQTGTLWWHRIRPNPGFIGILSGSNQWLVEEAGSPASPTGPTEAIEVLDLSEAFAADDRRLRHALLEEGIALVWRPTRRVYLQLDTDVPATWIGPIELVPRSTAAGDVRWRLDPATGRAAILRFACHLAAPDGQLVRARIDGQERCFLSPEARLEGSLPDWVWPADEAVLDWLAQQLGPMESSDDAENWPALRRFVDQLARRVERVPDTADASWLAWVDRALGRLDLQERTLEAAVLRLLDTPPVVSLRPPALDPKALRAEGYQAGRADAEREASKAAALAERAATEAATTIARLRQLISDERAELDQANLTAQREAGRRREAERQRDAADAELAAAQSRTAASQSEVTAARSAAQTAREQLAKAQQEIVALQEQLASASATVIERIVDPTGLTEMLALAQQQTAEAYVERARLQEELDALHTEAERQTLLGMQIDDAVADSTGWEQREEPERGSGDGPALALDPVSQGRAVAQLREEMHQLVELVQTFGSFGGPVARGPADRVADWTPPWASLPAPQPILTASVVQELRTAFRDAGLPGSLARPLWWSLQSGRLPVLTGDGARAALALLADLCFGGRRLPIEVDPGLLAPADLFGTLQDGRLRPSASRLADLLLQHADGLSATDDESVAGPALLALYGLTRAPADAYLLPLLAHYARPAWTGQPSERLGALLPAALDAADPYATLAGRTWPRGLLLAATIAEGTATIPPPADFWGWSTFHCLEHQGGARATGGETSVLADQPLGNGDEYSHGTEIPGALAGEAAGGTAIAVAVQRACTTVTVHSLFGDTPGSDGASAQEIERLGSLFDGVGAPLPSSIVRATTELAAHGYSVPSLLGSVLLPWAATVGTDRPELTGLLENSLSPTPDTDQSAAAVRLSACLGCMERLLR